MTHVAVVYRGNSRGKVQAHPVHREWFKSIGADEIVVSDTPLPGSFKHTILRDALLNRRAPDRLDHDIIIFESAAVLYCAPLIKRRAPDATLLFLDTSWRTYGTESYDFQAHSSHKKYVYYIDRWIDAKVLQWIYKHSLDGVLTVSEMMAEHIQSFADVPVEIVRPTIDDSLVEGLKEADPDLASSNAVYVGAARDHKGVDNLIEAWRIVRERVPNAKLKIVGSGHPTSYERVDGIEVCGYVPCLTDVFDSVSLQVHPARFDASPVSTLEGMRAGIPQVVTETTGTRGEVDRIDSSMVVASNVESLAAGIISYFDTPIDVRQTYSRKARKIGAEFGESRRAGEFNDALQSLIASV